MCLIHLVCIIDIFDIPSYSSTSQRVNVVIGAELTLVILNTLPSKGLAKEMST